MGDKLTTAIILLIIAVTSLLLTKAKLETWKIWIGMIIGAMLGFGFAIACVYLQLAYAIAQF